MLRLSLAISLVIAATAACAEPQSPIPTRGDSLSYLYMIAGVHSVATRTERVRAFEITASEPDEVGLALEVAADNREPNGTKAGRSYIWKLSATLSRVDSIELADNVVTIKGWSNRRGRVICTSHFRFVERVLSDQLDDRGCTSESAAASDR
jgi:hypothetical protein